MDKQQLFSIDQLSPEDWEDTPEQVKRLVESLVAGAALAESESRLIQFLDTTPIGIAVHDPTGQAIYINQAGRSLLGGNRPALDPNQLSDTFQVYREGTQTLYPVEALPSTRALAGETVWVDDLEIRSANRVIALEVWATPILDAQGQVLYATAAFQDISQRGTG